MHTLPENERLPYKKREKKKREGKKRREAEKKKKEKTLIQLGLLVGTTPLSATWLNCPSIR